MVIRAPIDETAATLANPANNPKWMRELKSYQPLKGTPGQPGSTSRMIMVNGNREMIFTATVVSVDLPHSMVLTLDSPMVRITARATFSRASQNTTRYISDQDFAFKGMLNKIVGFLAQSAIKKQQYKDMMYFKSLMEGQSVR